MGTRLSLEEKIGELITAQATTDAVSESTDDQVIITPTSSKFETSTSDAGLLVSLDELQVVDVLETTKSVSRKTFPHFDLETLLHTSAGGNSILKYYETYGFLNNTKRNQLTDIIIKHIYTYIVNYRITYEEYNIISAKIISLFPKESIGTYFTKPIKKNNSFNGRSTVARGKLVDKVRNLLYKYGDHTHKRQSGTLENAPPFKRQYIQGLQDLHLRDILFLNNNTEPWGEVIQKWKDTFKVRKESEHKSVHEFLQDWKILSDQRSDILINIDFDLLYPEKGLNFYLNWKIFFEKIIAFKPNRDERILNLIESLKNLDNDLTLPAELKILAHLVPPKGRISKKIKFTTQEAIDSLYICVPNAGDIDQVIKEQKQKATSKKLSVQPYVILQGSLLECGSPLLIVDDVRYQFLTITKAFDTLFKLYHTFNVRYPRAGDHLYLIIQRCVYNIETKYDNVVPYIIDVLNM
ncbi:uncharacterized protein LOC113231398 isoform X2 [Hyposmocoma kahamanoa]|nr:uncharacterized protein LOC113231398 isoform X2 [Hyposmocoma kahamanoa]